MLVTGNLAKLRSTAAVVGLFCILPLILLVSLVNKIFRGLCSLLGYKSVKNVAGEVALVSILMEENIFLIEINLLLFMIRLELYIQ